jgi:hypothetical protein
MRKHDSLVHIYVISLYWYFICVLKQEILACVSNALLSAVSRWF